VSSVRRIMRGKHGRGLLEYHDPSVEARRGKRRTGILVHEVLCGWDLARGAVGTERGAGGWIVATAESQYFRGGFAVRATTGHGGQERSDLGNCYRQRRAKTAGLRSVARRSDARNVTQS
jgi:hypothetical protein